MYTSEQLAADVQKLLAELPTDLRPLLQLYAESLEQDAPNFFQNQTRLWCVQQLQKILVHTREAYPHRFWGMSQGIVWLKAPGGWKLATITGGQLRVVGSSQKFVSEDLLYPVNAEYWMQSVDDIRAWTNCPVCGMPRTEQTNELVTATKALDSFTRGLQCKTG